MYKPGSCTNAVSVRQQGHRKGEGAYVESNVTVFPNTGEEQLDTTALLDSCFVGVAFSNEILGVSIEDVDVLGLDVDCRRKSATGRCC
jgi:hypothetical protein